MSKQHAHRKTRHNVKTTAKAGKDHDAMTTTPPQKAPQRTQRQPGGLRASLNRGAKSRTSG